MSDVFDAIDELHTSLMDDLDVRDGGCRWWAGFHDWPRLVLINDYLIGSTSQLRKVVELRQHHVDEFKEKWEHEKYRIRVAQGTKDDGYPQAGETEKDVKRRLRLEVAVRGFFDCAAHSLDLLGAIFLGVSAIKLPIQTHSWANFGKAERSVGQRARTVLDIHGSEGRTRQEEVIRAIRRTIPVEPSGWLEWTLQMRNTLLHRAGRIVMVVHTHRTSVSSRDEAPFYLLPAYPHNSDATDMAFSTHAKDIYLATHALDIMKLVGDNLDQLLSSSARLLAELWLERRHKPELLVQPGEQWPLVTKPDRTQRPGFPADISWPRGGTLAANPQTSARWQAAKFDDSAVRRYWGTVRE